MAIVDLVMPKLGESIMEATILHWNKKPGDHVAMDETVLEIATDKVDSEVPSTAEGVIEELLYNENDVVPIGTVIAKIRSENGVEEQAPATDVVASGTEEETEIKEVPYQPSPAVAPKTGGVRFYSPLVLNIAANEGVSLPELEKIPGTGNDGRVTKKDILQWIAARKESGAPAVIEQPQTFAPVQQTTTAVQPEEATEITEPVYGGNVEVIEMDRMRKLIAKHMVESKHTSAHVTSFTECDVTNMVLWREKVKVDFEKQEGEKLTFTPLFIEAIIKCIKKHPWLNASVDGDKIIVRKDINISMATALPNGNLIVPVIQEADMLNLTGLAKKVKRLANAARNNQLRPDDTQNGTFTVTNVGTFGSLMGTPIINQPQVAILAIGAIKKRPVVIETSQGDSIAIRHMMYLSLSYDHRIVDGSLGATFLTAVANEMESFDVNRSF
ncbi:dihydrolipoamide acetyltransferase family protein [Agriterribacter sp.]|uniref:dihydrolipoamide acetyltransferase family protein n=1 Tax=Agriterribacter sp. TaxID=2821509 RepID=UPI002C6D14A1|nr:dihydrolipoamide acetyltransferase family protein [Agriterribacter sp.]HRP56575.1 dihydrolipoamide acetyltransferase family protein [Agriterribacter sp.]